MKSNEYFQVYEISFCFHLFTAQHPTHLIVNLLLAEQIMRKVERLPPPTHRHLNWINKPNSTTFIQIKDLFLSAYLYVTIIFKNLWRFSKCNFELPAPEFLLSLLFTKNTDLTLYIRWSARFSGSKKLSRRAYASRFKFLLYSGFPCRSICLWSSICFYGGSNSIQQTFFFICLSRQASRP